ncbi:MAG: hypothetical protein IJB73_00960 [Firmicutes bacterium]|nr:hypothetical protein [Bacillota bacterium]
MEQERILCEISELMDAKLETFAKKIDNRNCFLPMEEIYKLKKTMLEVKEEIAELYDHAYEMECLAGKMDNEYKNNMTHMFPLRLWRLTVGQSSISSRIKSLEKQIATMNKQVEHIVVPVAEG